MYKPSMPVMVTTFNCFAAAALPGVLEVEVEVEAGLGDEPGACPTYSADMPVLFWHLSPDKGWALERKVTSAHCKQDH